jgi:CheY-like chemotaxis protein
MSPRPDHARILVVDDDPDVRDYAETGLADAG